MIPKDPARFDKPPADYPPVSFIIPAHNEARFISATLKQITRAATELGLICEVIVADDASTDRTAELANAYGAKVIHVNLRNIAAVRNAGAAEAQHDCLVFVDADTLIPKNTLAASLKALQKGCAGGGALVTLDGTKNVSAGKMLIYFAVSFLWQTIGYWAAGCFMFCRKEEFQRFGGFNEAYFAAEELFFSQQLKRLGKFQLVREPVITSARKFQGYSTLQLLRFASTPLWLGKGGNPLQSRRGLELLYEDDR